MNCRQAIELLTRMELPGAVPLPEELSMHVAACPRCAREYRELTAYRRLMHDAFRVSDTPVLRPGFSTRCMRTITAHCVEGCGFRKTLTALLNALLHIPTPAAVTTSVVAAVLIAVLVSHRSADTYRTESADGLKPPAVMAGVLGAVVEPIVLDVQRDLADRRGRELLNRFVQ